MSSGFYAKLAFTNIKKNKKTYLPYILTCIGTILMFYVMMFIASNPGLSSMKGGSQLTIIMDLGCIVIGIFAVIFLLYTNSFLIKRRKKEIGLYNILGLEKKHIAKMMFFEILYIEGISLIMGVFFGVILSKLLFDLLLRLLGLTVTFEFTISYSSIGFTILLFGGIFFITLLYNLLQVRMNNAIQLLHGSQAGEREPKTKWILTLLGMVTLGSGYYIALSVESPMESIEKFFFAVILVIIGTYSLFTAGSIAILKFLRSRKNFYYKTKYFTTISGMLYRMKQHAAGLASICILSTMVLIMVSATITLYVGMEDSLAAMYPEEIGIVQSSTKHVITEDEQQDIQNIIDGFLAGKKVTPTLYKEFRYLDINFLKLEKDQLVKDDVNYYTGNQISATLFSNTQYNILEGTDIELKEGEILFYQPNVEYSDSTISLEGNEYQIREQLDEMDSNYITGGNKTILQAYIMILNDKDYEKEMAVEGRNEESIYFGLDTGLSNDESAKIAYGLEEQIKQYNKQYDTGYFMLGSSSTREEFLTLYGGLYFLGLFLGILFMMATVLIIYYKQISEGYEDRERFVIMQKVGMSFKEVKQSIRSQVLLVFFIPLFVAILHVCFAFKMLTQCLALVILTNMNLFVLCTIGVSVVYSLIYVFIFYQTTKSYVSIVKF